MSIDQRRDAYPFESYDADEAFGPANSPGKRTLTMGLPPGPVQSTPPVQRKLDPQAAVQLSRERAAHSAHWMGVATRPDLVHTPVQRQGPGTDEGAVHQAAESGLQGNRGTLPHLGAVQKSFGKHDVSGIDAHVGGPAKQANEALGSTAYATGNSVAFKGAPDLHTTAHEAAHVVQQRQGVSLKGGVGQSGDVYERHADAVADRVVRGESAEDLLSNGPSGGSTNGPSKQSGGVQQSRSGSTGSPSVDYMQFSGRNQHGNAVQFDGTDSTPAQSGQQDQGVGLQASQYTQVQLSARIPTPIAGLNVEVTLTGKYTQGNERGVDFIEAEGVARVALTYRLLFLNLSVFLQGGLKFKVRNTTSWQTAFDQAFEDISHWVAARELADLPAKKREVNGKYNTFNREILIQIGTIRRESGSERYDQLRQESRPLLWWNSALANMVDARNTLVDDVRDVFSDMEGSINGNEVYPGTTWMRQQIQPHLDRRNVSGTELSAIRDALTGEADRRKGTVTSAMDNIPAIRNNPDVEFEGNLQVGFSAGVSISENTSASIELARGWRISDSMGSDQFDTSVQDVYTAALAVSGRVGSTNVSGQLAYEGVGGTMTSPNEFKVTGQVMAGIQAQNEDPNAYASDLQGVKARVCRAFSGSQAGGQSALSAIGRALKREMAANRSAQWSSAGSYMAGFSVEFKFRKSGSGYQPNGGQLNFVVVRSIGGSMGVFSGSIEQGNSVGIQW